MREKKGGGITCCDGPLKGKETTPGRQTGGVKRTGIAWTLALPIFKKHQGGGGIYNKASHTIPAKEGTRRKAVDTNRTTGRENTWFVEGGRVG